MNSTNNIKRVLLKISGEALMGSGDFGIETKTLDYVAVEVQKVLDLGIEVAIVVGGGNIFRGLSEQAKSFPRHIGDTMGMLATIMNGLALSSHFNSSGIQSVFYSALSIGNRVNEFSVEAANDSLSSKKVAVFGGGTSNPFFTTDTAAVLRALEMGCDAIIKATKVDGVYDSDPVKNPDAKFFKEISYTQVLESNLRVMDGTAIALARDNDLPLFVVNLNKPGAIHDALTNKEAGTKVIP